MPLRNLCRLALVLSLGLGVCAPAALAQSAKAKSKPAQEKGDAKSAQDKGEAKKDDAKKDDTAKSKTKAAEPEPAKLVDLNTAKSAELEELPGVGPSLAKAIIDARPFKSVDELDRVKGLGAARIAALRNKVSVGGKAASSKEELGKADPKRKTAAKGKSTTKGVLASGEKINLNTATQAELEELPGVGPAKAMDIIGGRPYKSIEDIMKVRGIKEGTFEKIKDYITVN